jgi:hypothetical protein
MSLPSGFQHADLDALSSLMAQLRQHVSAPVAIVESARRLLDRLQAARPDDARELANTLDTFERAVISPYADAAEALQAMAVALRTPAGAPVRVVTVRGTAA